MGLTLTVPEEIFEQSGREIARQLLEQAALEAFRAGAVSTGRLAEILDLTIDEANGFLKNHNLRSEITAADIQDGRDALDVLLAR